MNNMFDEFMSTPLSSAERSVKKYSDELIFRKARIYKSLGARDDRLQVQVMPELQGIEKSEMENLPKYPPFFKGETIQGREFNKDGERAEFVWVLCTPDLTVGYVLGKANAFGKPTEKYKASFSFRDIRSFLQQRRALPEDFDHNHIQVVKWVSTDKGGMIQCYNYLNGDWFVINTSGSMLTVQQKKIYLRVGTPPSPLASGPSAFSAITLTADKIHLKSPNLETDCQDIILGHHGFNAGGILGGTPSADNGVPVVPVSSIHL